MPHEIKPINLEKAWHEDVVYLYWIGGSAAICPKCGNSNAMLDFRNLWNPPDSPEYGKMGYECRDCGFAVYHEDTVSVKLYQDVENREYYGIAADGVKVSLGMFDSPWSIIWNYLKDHPTPDTW
jgi:predicted nucleic-acid-binding Zn-ribbon protein